MANFLDVADQLWKTGRIKGETAESFEELFQAHAILHRVHSKSELDTVNVESVFAAFEMAQLVGRFGDYSPDKINRLTAAMKTVIVHTIEETLRIPLGHQNALLVPEPYQAFVELVQFLRKEASPSQTVAIITFNYDLAIDFAFYRMLSWPKMDAHIDYGLDLDTKSKVHVPVLKLHGSLNWAECSKCGNVVSWSLNEYFRKHNISNYGGLGDRLRTGSNIKQFQHCDQPVKSSHPVIVPPTWNKSDYHRTLSRVWSRAAKELAEAKNIFVVGYSLPPSDSFFRYLYALGSVGDTPLKRFWVFDPDKTGNVKSRFQDLLGPGARQRFAYHELTFDKAITEIKTNLGGKDPSLISFV